MSKIYKNSKFRVAKIVKMTALGASKEPNLISRKVWGAEKIMKLHIWQKFRESNDFTKKKY